MRYATEKGKKDWQEQFEDSEYLLNVLENLRTLETHLSNLVVCLVMTLAR